MSSLVTMEYGAYSFSPRPLLTISKEYQKTDSQEIVGVVQRVTLEGQLVKVSPGGIDETDEAQDSLKSAMSTDGQLFRVQCDNNTLIQAYPRINSLEFSPTSNNWVYTVDYSIEMEWDEEPPGTGEDSSLHPPFISTYDESWTLEFVDDKSPFTWTVQGTEDGCPYQLRLTHEVSAVGKRHYTGGGLDKEAWEQAEQYVVTKLGYDADKVEASGTMNFDTSILTAFNHIRSNEVNESAGSYSVTESWLVINPSTSGVAGNALEDFTINIRTGVDTDITSVNIEGSIQGLETREYGTDPGGFQITEYKYTAASGYWSTIQGRLYDRAFQIANNTASRSLNTSPLSTSVGHNVCDGLITYTYEYDDRPSTCITNALSEVINIVDNNPVDVFAQLTVIGSCNGPVLQDITTQTARTRELSIEAVMPAQTICPTGSSEVASLLALSPKSDVDVVVDAFAQNLSGNWSQVFTSQDSESWNPFTGRYTRNVGWTYG